MRVVRMIWVPVILGGAAVYFLSGTGSDLERGSGSGSSGIHSSAGPASEPGLVQSAPSPKAPEPAVSVESPAAQEPAPEMNPAPNAPNGLRFADRLRDRLVVLGSAGLEAFDDPGFGARKFYLLYFAAGSSGPCLRLTTELLHAYKPGRSDRKYELILVSSDPSEAAMEQTMRQGRMPWPAIRFESRNQLARYAGPEVPCLVLVDGNGRVLSHTFQGKEMVGPGKVISDLERLLK